MTNHAAPGCASYLCHLLLKQTDVLKETLLAAIWSAELAAHGLLGLFLCNCSQGPSGRNSRVAMHSEVAFVFFHAAPGSEK